MMKKNSLQPTLKRYFAEYLPDVKGVSENTIHSYRYTFRLLLQFMFEQKEIPPAKVDFTDFSSETVADFLKWLEDVRGCSVSTRNQRLAALKSFSKYATNHCFQQSLTFGTAVGSMPRKKQPKPQMAYMTKDEMTIMLSLPSGNSLAEKRDRTLLSVLYASGARAQELCDIRVQDVRFGKDKTNLLLNGKGKKSRIVVIPQDCADLLKSHMRRLRLLENPDSGRHIFSSQTHEHMTISCVEGIVAKYVKRAKELYPDLFREKAYTPHSFRHSVAVHMLEAGIPLPVIKNFLGHSSIETTMVYATISQELRDKYLKDYDAARAASVNDTPDDGMRFPDYLET